MFQDHQQSGNNENVVSGDADDADDSTPGPSVRGDDTALEDAIKKGDGKEIDRILKSGGYSVKQKFYREFIIFSFLGRLDRVKVLTNRRIPIKFIYYALLITKDLETAIYLRKYKNTLRQIVHRNFLPSFGNLEIPMYVSTLVHFCFISW
jgi:hypothetical protein